MQHQSQHRIAVAFAAGLLASLSSAPVPAQSQPPQYLTMVWQTEQGLPQNSVSGDRAQLQQVGLNLIVNGMEAMSGVEQRPRELVITTRRIEPDQVQVTVRDSGIGLDPSTIGRIFEPFYTTKAGGMGMGLSICRSIVQNHGGRLWATVNDGPGTSFHFTLPKYHAGAADAGVAGV